MMSAAPVISLAPCWMRALAALRRVDRAARAGDGEDFAILLQRQTGGDHQRARALGGLDHDGAQGEAERGRGAGKSRARGPSAEKRHLGQQRTAIFDDLVRQRNVLVRGIDVVEPAGRAQPRCCAKFAALWVAAVDAAGEAGDQPV